MCLECGHTGCGRKGGLSDLETGWQKGHAYKHYELGAGHCLVMELNQKVPRFRSCIRDRPRLLLLSAGDLVLFVRRVRAQ